MTKFEICDRVLVYFTVEAENETEAYKKLSIENPYKVETNNRVVLDSSVILIERLTNDIEGAE
jgi:hypothetical protein